MQDILTEVESIKQRSQKSVNELRGLSEFFRIFTKTYQEETESFDQRLYEHQEIYKNVNDSILSANLLGIYDCFNQFIKNTQSLMTKITNELISPLEFFRNNQFNIYQNNIDELREVNKLNKKEKDMMEYFRQSYYQASDIIKKESKRRKSFFSEAKDTYDLIINANGNDTEKEEEPIINVKSEKAMKNVKEISTLVKSPKVVQTMKPTAVKTLFHTVGTTIY